MTRTRKLAAGLLLVVVVAACGLRAAFASDEVTMTYAYLPDHSIYFYDVADNYAWAHKEIDALAINGVVNGSGNCLFDPAKPITRADFIVMLDRAYGMSSAVENGIVASAGTFRDVPANTYYTKAVNAAKALGVANGTEDNRFMPKQNMTRQDAMVFLKRTLNCTSLYLPLGAIGSFSDASQVSGYARDAVSSLVAAHIIGGSGGKLNPKSLVTRAEMAVMLYRATHMTEHSSGASYQKRSDIVNLCIGAQVYSDVVIENYDPAMYYGELIRYSSLRQQNGVTYITLEENQPVDRSAVYDNSMLTFPDETGEMVTYPVASDCVAIDVSGTYHMIPEPASTGGIYRYCYPSVINGEITVIYYSKK